MNRLIIIGVAVLVALYVLFSSIFVVNEREQAVVMRFGEITQEIKKPGLYFKIPTNFIDTVQIIEDRLLRYDIANMTVQVKDGKSYVVDAFLTYRISNPRLFREKVQGNLQVAEDRISTRFNAALRQVYGLREFSAALSEQRPVMMQEARTLIKDEMALLGIDIVDVRILRTDLDPKVSAKTFERMNAERLAEAALLRASGQEKAQTLRAKAQRQAVEIVAAATKQAEIVRGQGDAKRNQVFAAAYNVDPEFFEFYRSMGAYRTALTGTGTTMVLSPESEFFKYFGSDGTLPNSASANAAEAADAAAAAAAATGGTPAATTETPAITTEAPAVTTEAPAVTTEAPAVTTEAPALTTEAPATTLETPATSTETPAVPVVQ
jgi:modulator of FtsH protease HflC